MKNKAVAQQGLDEMDTGKFSVSTLLLSFCGGYDDMV